MNPNIYFHFFDRELRKSINACITDKLLLQVICVSMYMTNGYFYLPISNRYESSADFPCTAELIARLEMEDLIYSASSHSSQERFLLSRQEMYAHEKEHYPMYFTPEQNTWSSNLLILKDSTTQNIKSKLMNDVVKIPELSKKKTERAQEWIKDTVDHMGKKAMTAFLFHNTSKLHKFSNQEETVLQQHIKHTISVLYTKRYLEIANGTIITGIPALEAYDDLAQDRLMTNYSIYRMIFLNCGINLEDVAHRELLIQMRKNMQVFPAIYEKMQYILANIKKDVQAGSIGWKEEVKKKLWVDYRMRAVKRDLDLLENILQYIKGLIIKNQWKADGLSMMNEKSIVIIAVTKTEMRAMLESARERFGNECIVERIEPELAYFEILGTRKKVYMVQSQMGGIGTGSVINMTHRISNVLNPEKIILGGIAFGCQPDKEKIGDILISRQVWYYERAKLTDTNTIDRGDKVSASTNLSQVFNMTALSYDKAETHFGLIASGEKLINSQPMIDDLKVREPEVLGGDMEAAGLVSVCEDEKIEWIAVKAISDWGVNKNDEDQKRAAENAFDFIMQNVVKLC